MKLNDQPICDSVTVRSDYNRRLDGWREGWIVGRDEDIQEDKEADRPKTVSGNGRTLWCSNFLLEACNKTFDVFINFY